MSIILQQKARIENLEKEKEVLEKKIAQLEQDIVVVVGSVKKIWGALGLDKETLPEKNKVLLITLILRKATKKESMEVFTEQGGIIMPIIRKYIHLTEEKPQLIEEKPQNENRHGN